MHKTGSTKLTDKFKPEPYTEYAEDLEVRYAEQDVERSLAKFSEAVDDLNQKISHTAGVIRKPKEKFLEIKTWVTAPENRRQVFIGGVALIGVLIMFRRWRALAE